jgi:hypothetical protein
MLTVSLSTTLTFLFFAREHDIVQEYRQICVNINRIKIAMEMGRRVVLCNLDNLYESLYDALNQVHVDRDQICVSDRGGGGRG